METSSDNDDFGTAHLNSNNIKFSVNRHPYVGLVGLKEEQTFDATLSGPHRYNGAVTRVLGKEKPADLNPVIYKFRNVHRFLHGETVLIKDSEGALSFHGPDEDSHHLEAKAFKDLMPKNTSLPATPYLKCNGSCTSPSENAQGDTPNVPVGSENMRGSRSTRTPSTAPESTFPSPSIPSSRSPMSLFWDPISTSRIPAPREGSGHPWGDFASGTVKLSSNELRLMTTGYESISLMPRGVPLSDISDPSIKPSASGNFRCLSATTSDGRQALYTFDTSAVFLRESQIDVYGPDSNDTLTLRGASQFGGGHESIVKASRREVTEVRTSSHFSAIISGDDDAAIGKPIAGIANPEPYEIPLDLVDGHSLRASEDRFTGACGRVRRSDSSGTGYFDGPQGVYEGASPSASSTRNAGASHPVEASNANDGAGRDAFSGTLPTPHEIPPLRRGVGGNKILNGPRRSASFMAAKPRKASLASSPNDIRRPTAAARKTGQPNNPHDLICSSAPVSDILGSSAHRRLPERTEAFPNEADNGSIYPSSCHPSVSSDSGIRIFREQQEGASALSGKWIPAPAQISPATCESSSATPRSRRTPDFSSSNTPYDTQGKAVLDSRKAQRHQASLASLKVLRSRDCTSPQGSPILRPETPCTSITSQITSKTTWANPFST